MPKHQDQTKPQKGMDRREFLKCTALLGGSLAASGYFLRFLDEESGSPAFADDLMGREYTLHLPENQIYSVCQQCNTNCGMKIKIKDGLAAKIDGNPYNPWTLTPHIPYSTPLAEAARIDGSLCPKGQAGIQALYDPYRIIKVLKRAGKRGENKWKTIAFDQAVQEIVQGGNLFGEGQVAGLKDLYVLKDPEISKALAEDAGKVAEKKMPLEEFKTRHKDDLHLLIDPDHPDLGPKNNQFCFNWGRLKGGRGELINRFTRDAFGSFNAHGHTTVCQGSLYFTCKAMSDQFDEGKFGAGSKFYWQADTGNAEFILFVGASPFEANYGPPLRVQKLTQGMVDGNLKIAVADPRCSKTAARAWKWLPIAPNGVGALAMAMMRWIIEHERYQSGYLANANKGAAMEDEEPTWTQATWLVKIGDDGRPGAFLRGSDLGLSKEKRPKKPKEGAKPMEGEKPEEWEFDPFMVFSNGKVQSFDPNSEKTAVEGDLLVDTRIKEIPVKSVLQILKEAAMARTMAQWAELVGVKEKEINELAQEFTSHGRKAVADIHRGVSQHTSGFYNVLSWMTVNTLMGNHDWKGGLSKATTYDAFGSKEGKPFDLRKMSGKIKPWGISIIRHETYYEKSTLFKGYPAKRNWYPFSSDIYQEVIPSMGDAYPYPIKALLIYMGSPVYSLPAGHELIKILSDPKKIPLVVASDIIIGETSQYADYIFPDLTYLERWEFTGSHPSVTPKVGPIRQPAAAPLTEMVTVFGEKMPISLESLLLALAEKLKLPGFGENAFGPGLHFKREEDLYLRMVANIASGDKADGSEKTPAADPGELEIFRKARQHLPGPTYEFKRWESLVGPEWWSRVVYVLNRGGRFQSYDKAYKDEQLANKYGKMVGIYLEKLATHKHPMTGKPYLSHANYVDGPQDCLGRLIEDKSQGFDMTLITYRVISQTKSRTSGNYWLQALYPENFVEISTSDAMRLGLKDGDRVKTVSASNLEGVWDLGNGSKKPMIGQIKVREGLRPGVVAFSLGHGHWAYGAQNVTIDGVTVPGDPRRGTGIHANAAMRVDPYLKNTGLVDSVGGSAVFYQSQVKLVKV
ncbi:MAG: molybdopterin-dependent oxidoreductase [Deltaproteobacteria bacterium]|nr:molybdopterin-dependent oxidoreductase [Deltaproteobacteria bacterium]